VGGCCLWAVGDEQADQNRNCGAEEQGTCWYRKREDRCGDGGTEECGAARDGGEGQAERRTTPVGG